MEKICSDTGNRNPIDNLTILYLQFREKEHEEDGYRDDQRIGIIEHTASGSKPFEKSDAENTDDEGYSKIEKQVDFFSHGCKSRFMYSYVTGK